MGDETNSPSFIPPGSAWEVALPLCAELAEQYRDALLDYSKLSELLRQEAGYLDKILKGQTTREIPQVRVDGVFWDRWLLAHSLPLHSPPSTSAWAIGASRSRPRCATRSLFIGPRARTTT